MADNAQGDNEERGRVVRFKPRAPVRAGAFSNLSADAGPVEDVGKYARGADDTDDYRHRMKMNALAVLVLALLIGGGIWIVDSMAQMRKNQDCALSGRRNCVQISVPLPAR